jgi:branched-chain amino acid transport system substrate-binding protein
MDSPVKLRHGRGIVSAGFALLLIAAAGCGEKEPIKVGFVAGLTGVHSVLGTSGRNGVQFAVEEVNSAGGIGGRKIALLTRDDKQDPEEAVRVDRELIDEEVVAIIGHMTSSMSVAAVHVANDSRRVMLSPTTTTNALTGIDDYFIRAISPTEKAIHRLALHAYEDRGLRRIVVVYDTTNKAFSEDWYTFLKASFQNFGEGTVVPAPFTPGPDFSASDFAKKILEGGPDGIVVVANPINAAVIVQQIRKGGSRVPLFSSMWAMTGDFIEHGGPAVEGITLVHWFHRRFEKDVDTPFERSFTQRFGKRPDFAAHFGYETAKILFTALAVNADPATLKETILKLRTFEELRGKIVIDEFGDASREVFLVVVKDGKFEDLER